MLVDSHCHLDFPDLFSDLPGVLRRAEQAGIGMMLTICTRLTHFEPVRTIAETHDNIYCSVGVHPHSAEEHDGVTSADLVDLAQHPKVVGIGETGLDYYYDNSPREMQRQLFREHISASRETGLPLIVHTRDADDDMIAILREGWEEGAFPGLIHCFSAGPALAKAAIDMGLFISVSGIATFKNANELRETLANVPLNRLLVETDAPFLAPVPHRGKTNEPSFVAHTATVLAEIKGINPDELAQATTDNFFALFSKVRPPNSGQSQ